METALKVLMAKYTPLRYISGRGRSIPQPNDFIVHFGMRIFPLTIFLLNLEFQHWLPTRSQVNPPTKPVTFWRFWWELVSGRYPYAAPGGPMPSRGFQFKSLQRNLWSDLNLIESAPPLAVREVRLNLFSGLSGDHHSYFTKNSLKNCNPFGSSPYDGGNVSRIKINCQRKEEFPCHSFKSS